MQSHGIVSDKAAAAALPVAPPAVGSDHPAPSGTPLRSPLCRYVRPTHQLTITPPFPHFAT